VGCPSSHFVNIRLIQLSFSAPSQHWSQYPWISLLCSCCFISTQCILSYTPALLCTTPSLFVFYGLSILFPFVYLFPSFLSFTFSLFFLLSSLLCSRYLPSILSLLPSPLSFLTSLSLMEGFYPNPSTCTISMQPCISYLECEVDFTNSDEITYEEGTCNLWTIHEEFTVLYTPPPVLLDSLYSIGLIL
jgi:hypothetical protein